MKTNQAIRVRENVTGRTAIILKDMGWLMVIRFDDNDEQRSVMASQVKKMIVASKEDVEDAEIDRAMRSV